MTNPSGTAERCERCGHACRRLKTCTVQKGRAEVDRRLCAPCISLYRERFDGVAGHSISVQGTIR